MAFLLGDLWKHTYGRAICGGVSGLTRLLLVRSQDLGIVFPYLVDHIRRLTTPFLHWSNTQVH